MPRQRPDGQLWIEYHGRCTSCRAPLDAAFMVWERVAWGPAYEGGFSCHTEKWTPVCEECVKPDEAAAPSTELACEGCGMRLSVMQGSGVKVCSRACYQRAARKAKRIKQRACETCRVEFASARVDARFCSPACRQWAYRLRSL